MIGIEYLSRRDGWEWRREGGSSEREKWEAKGNFINVTEGEGEGEIRGD